MYLQSEIIIPPTVSKFLARPEEEPAVAVLDRAAISHYLQTHEVAIRISLVALLVALRQRSPVPLERIVELKDFQTLQRATGKASILITAPTGTAHRSLHPLEVIEVDHLGCLHGYIFPNAWGGLSLGHILTQPTGRCSGRRSLFRRFSFKGDYDG